MNLKQAIKTNSIDLDIIRDYAIQLTEEMINDELIPHYDDENDEETAFNVQDIITNNLCKLFDVNND